MATSYGHMPASYGQTPASATDDAWAAYNGYGNAASYGYGAYPQAYQYDASAYQQGGYAGSWGVEQAQTTAAPQAPEAQPPIPGTDGQKLASQPSDGPEQPPLPEDPASTAPDTTAAGTPSAPAATTAATAYDPALYQQWYAYYSGQGQGYGASPQAAGAGYGSYPQSAPAADATTAASYASYAQQAAAAAGAAYAQAQAGATAAAGVYGSYQQPTSYSAYSQHPDTNAASQAYTSQQHSMGATTNDFTSTPSSFQARPPGPRPPPGDPPASSMQRQNSTSYNAAPPPKTNTGYNRVPPGVIRPQYNVRPAAGPSYASAASAAAVPRPPAVIPAPTPAFVRAGAANQPKVATVAAKSTAGASGAKFPPTFNSWVERCFERCRSDAERQAMTGRLSARIKSTEQGGNVWLVDWDKEPIPDITGPIGDGPPTPTGSSLGLRSKRSRWEDSNQQQNQQQGQQQWGKKQQNGAKKQQPDAKKQKQQQNHDSPVWSRAEINKRAQRAGRFGDGRIGNGGGGYGGYDSDDTWGSEDESVVGGVVVQGTSTDLEKSYFRLTGPPDPKEVRPPPVLKRALDRLVRMMRNGTATPFYAVDQFKGMRQDCTVQHLRNELAAAVYEAHGRASLEYGDLAEFNQCQTQLAAMYAEGVPGCVAEFNAYKLLYNLTHARSGANKALIHTLRVALTSQSALAAAPATTAAGGSAAVAAVPAADPQRAMVNALAARSAAAAGNYPGFFTAYAAAPNLGRAILDVLVPHVRWAALNVLVKAYKTSLPLTFVGQALGFIATKAAKAAAAQLAESQASAAGSDEQVVMAGCREPVYVGKAAAAATEEEGVVTCARWLEAHGAVLEPTGDSGVPMLDVKASVGKLFIPEEPKVSHGDDNLSLEDFLSRASGLAV